jgi:hypothetical protein
LFGRQLGPFMKHWWLLLMSRSSSDSATTGLGNRGYQSTGRPVAGQDQRFPGSFDDELVEVVGLGCGELAHDDFGMRRGLACATVLIDAETGRRVDVIPGRTAGAAGEWLRGHPGAEVVCRDGSGAYGEAVRRALPGAVQVSRVRTE